MSMFAHGGTGGNAWAILAEACWCMRQVATHRLAFGEVASRHLAAVVGQLLAADGVADVAGWVPLVTLLACEAAASLSPAALVACGVSDPRFYVKVPPSAAHAAAEPNRQPCSCLHAPK